MRHSKVPVRKLKGRKLWLVDLRYLGGKKTYCKTEDDALGLREAKLDEVRRHGTSALSFSHADRVAFSVAKKRLAQIGLTIEGAVEFCEKHCQTVTKPMLIPEALAILLREKEKAGNRERSLQNLKSNVQALSVVVGDKLLSEVSRDEIVGFLTGNGWAPATVRTKRIDLQTFFRAALARKWTTNDPTAALERETLDEKPPGILTVEQCRRLLKGAVECGESRMVGFIALALFCGIRPEEIEGMEMKHVQIDRGFAEVPAEVAKSRKRRLVEISEKCKAWLKLGLDLPPKNYRWRLLKIRARSGFESSVQKSKNGKRVWVRVPGDKWPHDCLRHCFGSYHLAMHGSADKTALQMGHRSTDMLFRHYRELVTKEEAERFWGIRP